MSTLILRCLEDGHSPFPEEENSYELLKRQQNENFNFTLVSKKDSK